MNTRKEIVTTAVFALLGSSSSAQFTIAASPSLTAPTDGVRIGTNTGTPPSALTVYGDEMDTPTGNVFETDALGNAMTSWKMLHGATEIGRLFSLAPITAPHFDIAAMDPMGRLRFWTSGASRGLFSEANITQAINGYTGLNVSGFLGIGVFNSTSVPTPFCKIHINEGGSQQTGYRPWMREGTIITYNSDQAYFGLKPEPNERNHAVIAWSDNDSFVGDGPDLLKFIFTKDNDYTSDAAGDDGLEVGRFRADQSGDEGYFGLGFSVGSVQPVERFHMLSGRIRNEQLPTDAPAPTLTKVLVVDDTPGLEYGVVKWRDITGLLSCDWALDANNHVVTAYTGHLCPPQQAHGVSIGLGTPRAKLDVVHTDYSLLSRMAIQGQIAADDPGSDFVAIHGYAGPVGAPIQGAEVVGVIGQAHNGRFTTGVRGVGFMTASDSNIGTLYGVHGHAVQVPNTTTNLTVGVIGTVDSQQANAYAGWFGGDVMVTGAGTIINGPWTGSDAMFKTNVQPLTGSLSVIAQLNPNTYDLLTVDFPMLGLPLGNHPGLIAQELEQVLPGLVRTVTFPEQHDSLGNTTSAAFEFKVVRYEGLIPYTIGAINEQQAMIVDLFDRVETLEQQLAACCSSTGSDGQRSMFSGIAEKGIAHTDLFIIPNPVADLTQLRYTIATPGRTRLEVADSQGKRIEVLEEAVREVGTFEYGWNTQDLAPGTYHCILYLNDTFVVKKAVKVAR